MVSFIRASKRRIENFLKNLSEMPGQCVAGGCSNTASLEKGIALHIIPFDGDKRPEAMERRKRRVHFVEMKCGKWEWEVGAIERFCNMFLPHTASRFRT